MRNFILSTVTAAILAFPVSQASAFTAIGTVEAVSGHEVIIRNGDAYRLPANYDLSHIKAGQKVAVTWQSQTPDIMDLGEENYVRVLDATEIVVAE
ncbi:hypothetical protein GCM10011385_39590 [Nitratireductor aestuarii]|uniref:DUF1344 domain-containing protein n=1 Tax=Nitratireductor aestuarii TaxID=1735103 RepID=A0A916WA25_9HYPH|nr:hypothetical protein [Nitratireductor aestuarii]GGA81438.1 hypothetical protein GCM10011385_39590 [Nitratireductor aestuarii]